MEARNLVEDGVVEVAVDQGEAAEGREGAEIPEGREKAVIGGGETLTANTPMVSNLRVVLQSTSLGVIARPENN